MKPRTAAWIVAAVAAAVIAGIATSWLFYPSPLSPGQVELPALRGVPAQDAVAQLAAVGARGRISAGGIDDPLVPAGAVSWQSPVAGTVVPESTVVNLGISAGPPRVMVPDLVDLEPTAALRVLRAAGLSVAGVDSMYNTAPIGVILGTRPEARQPIRVGSGVELIISKGPRSSP